MEVLCYLWGWNRINANLFVFNETREGGGVCGSFPADWGRKPPGSDGRIFFVVNYYAMKSGL